MRGSDIDKMCEEIADRIDKHADNIIIDFYGDKPAERFRSYIRELADSIRNPSKHDETCFHCGAPLTPMSGCCEDDCDESRCE